MRIVLLEPEIPPNTGNIARLCAATGTPLHLIEPLGFSLADKYLKRAGLDYWPHVRVRVWPDLPTFLRTTGARLDGAGPVRVVASSSNQGEPFHGFAYRESDCLLLGRETEGLPADVLASCACKVRIPIRSRVRSLNLSTAAGILLYEALRSTGGLDKTWS